MHGRGAGLHLLAVVLLMHAVAAPASARTEGLPEMTAEDRTLADGAIQLALETRLSGTSTFWRNDTSGNSGAVVPVRTYRTVSGRYCRVYDERLFPREARIASLRRTACRDDGGIWRDVQSK